MLNTNIYYYIIGKEINGDKINLYFYSDKNKIKKQIETKFYNYGNVNIQDACELLGITKQHYYRLITTWNLNPVKVKFSNGGKLTDKAKVYISSLESYTEKHKEKYNVFYDEIPYEKLIN